MPRSKGRPRRDAATEAKDLEIAVTVLNLLKAGFPGRSPKKAGSRQNVYDVVADLAHKLLKRTDHDGKALGPDSIEKIYKQRIEGHYESESAKRGFVMRFRRYRYTREGLLGSWHLSLGRPLHRCAEALLKNHGHWPDDWFPKDFEWSTQEAQLSPSAEAELSLMPKLGKRGKKIS